MKYPIGQQDFQSIREEGYVYIDKTDLIYDLVHNSKYVFLSRPRRFGKSLLLSTIKAYLEGKKELFGGLRIETLEKDWEKYPVLHLSLSRIDSGNADSLTSVLDEQFRIWEKELGIKNENPDFSSRFSTIIRETHRNTGKKVVILIDEYDNPLINTLHDSDIHEKNRSLLKSLYSNLKDLDSHIKFGMLTGVSRFSKMTIFSGLNNLNDISFDNKYSTLCGFTKEEIIQNLQPGIEFLSSQQKLSIEEAIAELKKWYDGYHFSENCVDIYNPFSILKALYAGKISFYWMLTATPEFLIRKLKESSLPFIKVFHEEATEKNLSTSDLEFSSPSALLFQTGYLTIRGYNVETRRYLLGIPNKEIDFTLFPTLLGAFTGQDSDYASDYALEMKQNILNGEPEQFLKNLKEFLGRIPYTVIPEISEKYFQNTLYLLFTVMGLEIEAEKATSFGRSDLIIKTNKFIYIFELKLNKSAKTALKQIEEKEYDLPFRADGRKIIKIGLGFSSKTRALSSWAIAQ